MITADLLFAKAQRGPGCEFKGTCEVIRYAVALNPDATKAEFIAAAASVGFNKHTVAIQFTNSRKFDMAAYDLTVDADGRLLY